MFDDDYLLLVKEIENKILFETHSNANKILSSYVQDGWISGYTIDIKPNGDASIGIRIVDTVTNIEIKAK